MVANYVPQAIVWFHLLVKLDAFSISNRFIGSRSSSNSGLAAAPRRLEGNVDGVVYVNEKCINCAACSQFAPTVFGRDSGDRAHIVYHQPESQNEIDETRAALAACPVAAIRVENAAQRRHRKQNAELSLEEQELAKAMALNPKFNNRELPFPRLLTDQVWFVGHHNDASFGATPYLFQTETGKWILVDTPRFGSNAMEAVTSLTGPQGPDYLFLTHVDDTADHWKWKQEFPNLKRIFHSGDLGRYNWLNDDTLNHVEILLKDSTHKDDLTAYSLDGTPLDDLVVKDKVVILHTPGHSPGSISLWKQPSSQQPGILFTGDTYAYSTRNGGRMSGFPRYGNNLKLQAETIPKLFKYDWDIVAPGHGHVRDYTKMAADVALRTKQADMEDARQELLKWA